VRFERSGHGGRETVAVDRKRSAGGNLIGVRRTHHQRTRLTQLVVQEADSIRLAVVRPEAVGADELGQLLGAVRGGCADGAHFMKHDRNPALRDLPGGFRAREAPANDMDCLVHRGLVPPAAGRVKFSARPRRRRFPGSGSAALAVLALGYFLHNLRGKRLQIAGMTRCDEAFVGHDLLVLPPGAGIDQIGLHGFVGRHLAAFGDAGVDQQPRRMADGGNHLLLVEELADQFEGVRIGAQRVRVHLAAGQNDCVVIGGLHLVEGMID
jgi:hypothetical protein